MDSSKCSIPQEYIWPEKDMVPAEGELVEDEEPLIDLEDWFLQKPAAAAAAACDNGDSSYSPSSSIINGVRSSCLKHGFFQVINHGVDSEIIRLAHLHAKAFFKLPITEKLKGQNQPGSQWGFSLAHTSRFSDKLHDAAVVSFFTETKTTSAVDSPNFLTETFCQTINRRL